MGEEHCIEDLGQERYRPLGKMLQSPVRDTVGTWSLAHLETHDGVLDVIGVG